MPMVPKQTGPRSTLSTLRRPILGDGKENAAVCRNEQNVKNVATVATGQHNREPLKSLHEGNQSLPEASTKTMQNVHAPGTENRGSATASTNSGRSGNDPEGLGLDRVQTAATIMTKTAAAANVDGQAHGQPHAPQTQSRVLYRSRLADLQLKMQVPPTENIQVYQQRPSSSSSQPPPDHRSTADPSKRTTTTTATARTTTVITTARADSTTSASLETFNSTINRPISCRGREAVEKLSRRTVTLPYVYNTRNSAATAEPPAASVHQAPCERNARENQPPVPAPPRPEVLGVIENKGSQNTAKASALNTAASLVTKSADATTAQNSLDGRLLASLLSIPFELDIRADRTNECLWRRRKHFEATASENENKAGVAATSSLAASDQKQQHSYMTQVAQHQAVRDSHHGTEEGDDDDEDIEWIPVLVPTQEDREVAEEHETAGNPLPAQEEEECRPEKRRKTDMAEVEQLRQDFYDYSPQLVREYAEDDFSHMREMELLLAPDLNVADNLSDAALFLRIDLVHMISEFFAEMSSPGETLFLAVHILDRVITRHMRYPDLSNRLHRDNRVIGLICLMIAGKYEEMTNRNYRLAMFLHITTSLRELQGEVDAKILQRNERDVLNILDYKLGWPGPLSFLRRCSRADEGDQFARTGAKFVLELMMLDIRFLRSMPSLQAAAAIFVARFALGRTAWNSSMAQYSGYELKDIEPVVNDIVMLLRENEASDTFPYHKYCTRVNFRISKFLLNWAQRLRNLNIIQQLKNQEEMRHQEEEYHEEYYECEEYDEWTELE